MKLQTALKFASEFVGKDPERPWLHGVAVWLVDGEPGMVMVTATTGAELAKTFARVEYHTISDHVILCPKELGAALKQGVADNSEIIDLAESVLIGDRSIRRISRDIPWPDTWQDAFVKYEPGPRQSAILEPGRLSTVLSAFKRIGCDKIEMQMFGDNPAVRLIDRDRIYQAWVAVYASL